MTTVVYDGRFLVSDRRATGVSTGAIRIVKDKLTLFRGERAKFRGETLIGAGGAGNANDLHRAMKLLKEGEDIEEVYENYFKVHQGKNDAAAFSLLIVTDKNSYTFRTNSGSVSVHRYPKDAKVAIGTGTPVARLIFGLFNGNAHQAVVAASIGDCYGTGDGLLVIDTHADRKTTSIEKVSIKTIKLSTLAKSLLANAPVSGDYDMTTGDNDLLD